MTNQSLSIMKTLKIATRNSPLALWQARHVKQQLLQSQADLQIELVKLTTTGDRLLDSPLNQIGGKGLFLKELEQALLNGTADIAVHSMKDVTVELPAGLDLPVIMAREDSRDVFVSNHYSSLATLPAGSVVGTSSLRRQSQIGALRTDLKLCDQRGNVGRRLQQLEDGLYDAIILAAAGMKRLGLMDRMTEALSTLQILPAVGQGAIGIECRADDALVKQWISPLNHVETANAVQAERAFSRRLFGGCQLPIAAHAQIAGNEIKLTGLVAALDGSLVLKASQTGSVAAIDAIGIALAETLLERGADKILDALRQA